MDYMKDMKKKKRSCMDVFKKEQKDTDFMTSKKKKDMMY